MGINLQGLYNQTHQFSAGIVNIDAPFVGNVLAIELTTKPEYVPNSQIIGYLYQHYQTASKGYALRSGKDIVSLELPETESLDFVPTPYLSDSYTLSIKYATIGAVIDGENTIGLPQKILDLPNNIQAIDLQIEQIEAQIQEIEESIPTWDTLTSKPQTFPPSTHNHGKADITDLSLDWAEITGKPSTFAPSTHNHGQAQIEGLPDQILDFESRITFLEQNSGTNTSKNAFEKLNDIIAAPMGFFWADIKALAVDFVSENNLMPQSGSPNRSWSDNLSGLRFMGGSSAHYSLPHNLNLEQTGDLTYMAIVRTGQIPFANPANLQGMLCKQTDSAGGHSLFIVGNRLSCEFTNSSGQTFSLDSSDTLQSNTTYCLRVYRQGAVIGTQINTLSKTEATNFTGSLAIQPSAPLRLGNKVSSTFAFSGVMYLAACINGLILDSEWQGINNSFRSILG